MLLIFINADIPNPKAKTIQTYNLKSVDFFNNTLSSIYLFKVFIFFGFVSSLISFKTASYDSFS